MAIRVTLKNYRRFADSEPARFTIGDGLTSFVGPNNSGKSTLLRFFYEFRELFRQLSGGSAWGRLASGDQIGSNPAGNVSDRTEVFPRGNQRPIDITFEFDHLRYDDGSGIPSVTKVELRMARDGWNFKGSLPELLSLGAPWNPDQVSMSGTLLMVDGTAVASVGSIAEEFSLLARSMYIGSFRNVINVGGNEQYFDIQTGTGFVEAWKRYQSSGNSNANVEAADRVVDDIKAIFGLNHFQMIASYDGTTLQTLVDHQSFNLGELGSGIAQFVVTLANVAIRRPTYVFIDEPELGLHPSLQLDFLTTLASYAQHGVVFATHSYGLARSGAERVYAVRQVDSATSELRPIEAMPRISEFLGEMNFSSYREMGFEKVLLVEGRTDVKTVHQFLRKVSKDHQIVLIPLGGSGLINGNSATELDELKRITSQVAVLIDSERSREGADLQPDRVAFVSLCRAAGFEVHVLELRAIENYFPDRAVKAALGDAFGALGPFEILKQASNGWQKASNWQIAREMNVEEIGATDLGSFIAAL